MHSKPSFFARWALRCTVILPAVLLAACAAPTTYRQDVRSIPVKGTPLTPDPPYALEKLVPLLSITSGCKETPKSVTVALISKSDDIRTNAAKTALISGSAREAWNFEACGRTIPMFITYTFMPDGQTAYQFAAK
ncbi:hypothetical protein LMG3458_05058 [Achromobacter deleyi]|uniref:Lipoprotein n=1 Tax=Achromobacter deleyi TaxID=1353891 RepID=A0A6S7ASX8_9BURK|nr:hypothetical protein [Achromobacter deleyi]CAB3733471.1 hypothetical protein LMG3458_05058 [Achromobacter deleyi]CAB3890609.1 hypothetical protein LMG3412_03733 [Achromobacter deleyi]CAB3908951.1 hypothetical protein LMG3481_04669 [Achromobacter deleyi]CAB3909212.1 hypothetical protein LMG3482_04725 [Achromobacter deleyi]